MSEHTLRMAVLASSGDANSTKATPVGRLERDGGVVGDCREQWAMWQASGAGEIGTRMRSDKAVALTPPSR